MHNILVIDDERAVRTTIAEIMEDEGYTAFTAEDAVSGMEILSQKEISIVILDVLLPKLGGIEALEKIRAQWPETEVIVISGHANIDTAVKAVKLGAFDYLEKPLSIDKLSTACRNAILLISLREENAELKRNAGSGIELIGDSPQIEQVRSLIRQAAGSDARILITGENGSGKELVARAVHKLSSRANAAFIEVNCAAIPDNLIESELFGHEKGAFTDAVSRRRGRFELASGGTLFLDEIGDMSLNAQAKVLRAIQEQKIERVGGEKSINVDVRIVAATNKNLEDACNKGAFRQDLFFRLNVIPIHMSALRERPSDIEPLLHHFLGEAGAGAFTFDDDARTCLTEYPWPGNVRELKNLAERIAVLCNDDHIGRDDLENLFLPHNGGKAPDNAPSGGTSCQNILDDDILKIPYSHAKELFEKRYLEYQLKKNDYIMSRTAEAIGMYPGNLHAKLRKFGIEKKV
ncbi:MAG: sigma-54 dependent transcriptional regulator [Spirochaetaceae bacterium]|jgi:two-component system nitrogen regulation response regulator NtrX|nr:sigma-54 dependent transcriptional regulator [Spirochaetaceae bacterium]